MFYSILQGVIIGLISGFLSAKVVLFIFNKKRKNDDYDTYFFDHWEG